MKFAYALIVAGLLCTAAVAQDVSVIVYRPVAVPAKVVYVERYFPLNRLLFGRYRVVVVPVVEKEKAAK